MSATDATMSPYTGARRGSTTRKVRASLKTLQRRMVAMAAMQFQETEVSLDSASTSLDSPFAKGLQQTLDRGKSLRYQVETKDDAEKDRQAIRAVAAKMNASAKTRLVEEPDGKLYVLFQAFPKKSGTRSNGDQAAKPVQPAKKA